MEILFVYLFTCYHLLSRTNGRTKEIHFLCRPYPFHGHTGSVAELLYICLAYLVHSLAPARALGESLCLIFLLWLMELCSEL